MRRYPCPRCGKIAALFHGNERADGSRYELRAGGAVKLCTDCLCDWLDAEVIAVPTLTPNKED